jgi:hypothetical protein
MHYRSYLCLVVKMKTEKRSELDFPKSEGSETPCVFWENVTCTLKRYRPNECLNVRCSHYQRWERMMDEENERDDAEVEEALRSGVHPDEF